MKQHILHTVHYFGLFRHPLTRDELLAFLGAKTDRKQLEEELRVLIGDEQLVERGPYLQRAGEPDFSALREAKEARARKLLEASRRYAGIIARFPFVRSVAVSGSTSKLAADEGADLDFFIITAGQRLWIARTLLHLFKKLTFLTGHERYFCMNYFVDEDHLELPFQNLYTAIELKTLVPVYGGAWVARLKASNGWTVRYLPNHGGAPLARVEPVNPPSAGKKMLEAMISLFHPGRLNDWLMRLTDRKWKRKFAHLNLSQEEYDRAMMTRPYLSKNHPHDYQKRVMEALKNPGVKTPVNACT